ncbi:hypothetical protein ACOZXQ_004744, partial [Cronobacter malonaticus]
ILLCGGDFLQDDESSTNQGGGERSDFLSVLKYFLSKQPRLCIGLCNCLILIWPIQHQMKLIYGRKTVTGIG